jgi:hypothetical protein
MKKLFSVLLALSLCFTGACIDTNVELGQFRSDDPLLRQDNVVQTYVTLEMNIGNYKSSGKIEISNDPIEVDWTTGIAYSQVIAEVAVLQGDTPSEYLRTIFSSDRIEFVSSESGSSFVYDSEDECFEEGVHCDEVIPGQAVSGVFDTVNGTQISVSNIHCSASMGDYEYSVFAYVVDMSGIEPVPVSDVYQVDITCIQI